MLAATGVEAQRNMPAEGRLIELLGSNAAAPAALKEAAGELTAAAVRALPDTGGLAALRGNGGITALMLAAACNRDPEVVRALVDAGRGGNGARRERLERRDVRGGIQPQSRRRGGAG